MKHWLRSAFVLISLTMPLAAQAECPAESSISRYVESTGEALDVLRGSVPEAQYRELDDRYAAMVIMKWDRLGLTSLADEHQQLNRVGACLKTPSCGAERGDSIDTQITSILQQIKIDNAGLAAMLTDAPSQAMLDWAETTLGCREPATVPIPQRQDAEQTDPIEPVSVPTVPEAAPPEVESRVAATAEPALKADATTPSPQTETLFATAMTFIENGQSENAIAPLKQVCDEEVSIGATSTACDTLLDIFKSDHNETNNSDAYLGFAEELCAKDFVDGCLTLANHYRYASQSDAPAKFETYTTRACDLGSAEACATRSNAFLANGATSEADLLQARTLRQKSCDLGRHKSCLEVADMYLSGVGGAPNKASAIEAASEACPSAFRGNADVCVSAAYFVLTHMAPSQERADKIRAFTERACDNDHAFGCSLYATDLERGLRGAADPERASLTRLKACELGDKESCRTRS